jgi:hypothetical protein
MSTYKLINPVLVGKLDFTIKSTNADTAIQKIWNNLSEHITEHVPQFAMSLLENKSNKLFHYNVNETSINGEAEYNIVEIKIVDKNNETNMLKNYYNNITMNELNNKDEKELKGGNKRYKNIFDDSDNDYVVDYDILVRKINLLQLYNYYNNPIYYVNYYPMLYSLNNVYLPRFNLNPLVELTFASFFL